MQREPEGEQQWCHERAATDAGQADREADNATREDVENKIDDDGRLRALCDGGNFGVTWLC